MKAIHKLITHMKKITKENVNFIKIVFMALISMGILSGPPLLVFKPIIEKMGAEGKITNVQIVAFGVFMIWGIVGFTLVTTIAILISGIKEDLTGEPEANRNKNKDLSIASKKRDWMINHI